MNIYTYMQVVDVYTKKEYMCKKCNAVIFYGKITDDSGKLITEDGQTPNGKFGRDSNVLSGAVDANAQTTLHECSKHYVEEAVKRAGSGTQAGLKDFKREHVRDQEEIVWNDVLAKTAEYVILAQKKLEEYPEIENPALKGLVTKLAFEVMGRIQARE